MDWILNIQNLHKSFADTFTGLQGREEREIAEVLKGVSMQLQSGTVTALIGTNGSGKSTLFNLVSGLLQPDKGAIEYRYENRVYNLVKEPSYRHAGIGIARLFQGSKVFENLSVLENFFVADNDRNGEQPWHIFLKPRATAKTEKHRFEEAAYILSNLLGQHNPIWEKRNLQAGSLSIGQQRLLAFARLFMNEKAQLYLLDEPCAGLNEQEKEVIAAMIKKLHEEGKTVLLIEHNTDFALATATDAYYLEAGDIRLKGNIYEVMNNPVLQKGYMGIA